MTHDFDEIIDRSNTNAMAKQGYQDYLFEGQDPVRFPVDDSDVISIWVADMAFASAPAARQAMVERIESHPIFGYSALLGDDMFNAFADWCDLRYQWRPRRDHFVNSPGIVPALYDLVEFIVKPDEKVLTLTPAYGMFKRATAQHDRELVTCRLIESPSGQYTLDLADFEAKMADPKMRMFFLCHPHNPTGRVWTDDELSRMAEICFANDVIIISDEIHCDLLRTGVSHTPLAKLFPESDQIITCMSASKTFNLAGLGLANVMIPNDEIREIWIARNTPLVNPVSVAAARGVFENGHGWLAELAEYLDANFEYIRTTLAAELPDAVFNVPAATYLAWIDLSSYLPPDLNLTRYFAESVGVLLEGGDMFIADADGHIRVNAACPRSVLADALGRIIKATLNPPVGSVSG